MDWDPPASDRMWNSIHRIWAAVAARLSRVTSSREFIPEVDGLRFLAIIPVIAPHAQAYYLVWRMGAMTLPANWIHDNGRIIRTLASGFFGVSIFFVVSGFVLSLAFARHYLNNEPRPALDRYFLRRVTRIEPPYLVALTVMFVAAGATRERLPHYLAGLIYLHKVIFGTLNPIGILTWSLEVEVMFYLIAPLLAHVYRIRPAAMRRVLMVIVIALSTYWAHFWVLVEGPERMQSTIASSLHFFLAGMLLADLYVSGVLGRADPSLIGCLWDVAAIASVMALSWGATDNWILYSTSPFLIMILFIGALQGSILPWFLRLKPITIIGGMCYTLYLWHEMIVRQVGPWIMRQIPATLPLGRATLLNECLMIPLIILISIPLFYFLEKPFMNGPGSRYLESVLRRTSKAVTAPTGLIDS